MHGVNVTKISNGVQGERWVARQQIGRGKERKIVRGTGKTPNEAIANFNANMSRRMNDASSNYVKRERIDSPMLSLWIDECCRIKANEGRRDTSVLKFRRVIENHVLPHLDKPIASISRRDVTSLFDNELNDIGTSARKHAFQELRNMFNMAIQRELIVVSPMHGMKTPAHQSLVAADDERWISRRMQRYAYALDWIEDADNDLHHLYPRMLLMSLGLRRAELLGLTWDCVSLAKGKARIVVKQQLQLHADGSGWFIQEGTKNRKSRHVPLPERFRLALIEQRRTNDVAMEVQAAGVRERDAIEMQDWEHNLVFRSHRGRRVTYNDHRDDWVKFLTAYYNRNNEKPVPLGCVPWSGVVPGF